MAWRTTSKSKTGLTSLTRKGWDHLTATCFADPTDSLGMTVLVSLKVHGCRVVGRLGCVKVAKGQCKQLLFA